MSEVALFIVRPSRARALAVDRLRQHQVEVLLADTFGDALASRLSRDPDVVVLDLSLEDVAGVESCRRIRETLRCLLIAIGDEAGGDRPAALLRAGADDYLARPYSPLELAARVRAALRRIKEYSAHPRTHVEVGPLTINGDRHEVTVRGRVVELAPKEFELLLTLASRPNELFTRDELLGRVWGYAGSVASRTLDVHIGRIRRKIERDRSRPELIITVPHLGYKLAA